MSTVLIIIGALVLAFFIFVKIVGPNEMGIRVFLGKPSKKSVDSGPRLQFWPIVKIAKYTKEQMELKFTVKSIMTKKGKVRGYKRILEPTEMNIECAVLAYFSKENLNQTIQKAPGKNAQQLAPYLVPYVKDAVRALGGRLPWRLINEERHLFAQWIRGRMIYLEEGCPIIVEPETEEQDNEDFIYDLSFDKESDPPCRAMISSEDLKKTSPFVQYGLVDVSFMIEDINFVDEELQKAISAPEKESLQAQAKRVAADGERYKREEEGKGDAKAREAMIKVIKQAPDLEVLYTLREMAQGTSNTILYQIPGAFEGRIRDIMGGNNLGKLLDMLGPEDKQMILETINETIRKASSKK